MNLRALSLQPALLSLFLLCLCAGAGATPANRAALDRHFGTFLPKKLDSCTTCHLPGKTDREPTSLSEFPHNPFGNRLRLAAEELRAGGKRADIVSRLKALSAEDSDGDGVNNETEILLGHLPGDPKNRPAPKELANFPRLRAAFAKFLASYRWQPFEPVQRPRVPTVKNAAWTRNPIDAFLAAEHEKRGLKPRPPASKSVLLRRVTLDLTGLVPTPDELRAFENDTSPDAYEKVVDRLLASPRYGERWGRQWMDVWRYSDWAGWTDGGQVRDSKPHIWRWRDWIVESLNRDKGYDRMALEMLAADELAPEDTDALRATGFLVRNFKLLSREQWMEDTLTHTSKAFLGLTVGCAKCHNHMSDPITSGEYYKMRAIFEPHNVRTDRIPGQPDAGKDGLVRVYDADPEVKTYFYPRGDEHNPDKSRAIVPGVPEALGGAFSVKPVPLPRLAYQPDKREFVIRETLDTLQKARDAAKQAQEKALSDTALTPQKRELAAREAILAESRLTALQAVLAVEKLEDAGQKESESWKQAAADALKAQRIQAVRESERNLLAARLTLAEAQAKAAQGENATDKAAQGKAKAALMELEGKVAEAQKALAAAEKAQTAPLSTAYQPRVTSSYPTTSTGRRLAFARWLTDRKNPLTARVAVNQMWMRHFGAGIVPSVADFGRKGRAPTHPQLLDWLAAELMARNWQMKPIHRMMVTSSAYRMDSRPDAVGLQKDPDNTALWRMSSRRMEAEVVRDNVLFVTGQLDETMGGPEVDHNQGLASRRRSIYLRIAAEKEVEFLKIFDGPSVTECYERKPSVMPQQALALANSELTLREARRLASLLDRKAGRDAARFTKEAFLRVLSRRPTAEELSLCVRFLREQPERLIPKGAQTAAVAEAAPDINRPSADPVQRARENLMLVLLNHNDFVTVR